MAKKENVNEPTILDHIEDESEQAQAIADFRSLINHSGWKRIAKFYQDVMHYRQEQLNGDEGIEEIKTIDDLKLVRFKRDEAERLINLPEILLELVKMKSEEIEFDPHFKPDDFNDKIK